MVEAKASHPSLPPPCFLEVRCKRSGETRRFAEGTEAGFAVELINRKLDSRSPLALHIEAIKEAQEPISFGPNAVLIDYGDGWKLQTVTEMDYDGVGNREGKNKIRPLKVQLPHVKGFTSSPLANLESKPVISFLYVGKIVLAFALIFVLGAIFTLALENLPRLISILS